jgi:hypothetical protein
VRSGIFARAIPDMRFIFFFDRMGELSRACGRDLHAISEISLVLVTARAARTERDDLDQHLALGTRRPARSHG